MAAEASSEKVEFEKKIAIEGNFEAMVKNRIQWDDRKWREEGEKGNRLQKVINSIKFWRMKLDRALGKNNVVLGLFDSGKETTLKLMNVINALDDLNVGQKIVGYTSFRNPRYLSIVFDSCETKKFVESNLTKVGNAYVFYLSWASSMPSTVIKFHWVPFDLAIENIIDFLDRYVHVNKFFREELKLCDGRVLKNGTMNFYSTLKDGVSIRDIPHTCEIERLELLINIPGRDILCLNCDKLGHKSSECDKPYCKVCKKKIVKEHVCSSVKEASEQLRCLAESTLKETEEGKKEENGSTIVQSIVNVLSKGELLDLNKSAESLWNTDKVEKLNAEGGGAKNYNDKNLFYKKTENIIEQQHFTQELERDDRENQDMISDDDSENINKVKDYFTELINLQEQQKISGEPGLKGISSAEASQVMVSEDMEIDSLSLKRKLDKDWKKNCLHLLIVIAGQLTVVRESLIRKKT